YEVQQEVGKQAGRWTLIARDLTNEQLVVLKVLFIDENMGSNDLKLFGREVDILKALYHPAIPRYLNYFELDLPLDGRALALVQTYIPGKSLQTWLHEGRSFTEPEVIQIGQLVLDILVYLHGCKPPVIHRDIKPGNIILNDNQAKGVMNLYLVDFGSVKSIASSSENAFTIVGTEGFMPPEQFGGRAVISSDLYSLGMTLTTLVTGLEPVKLPRSGIRVAFEHLPNISHKFAQWLAWMTEPRTDRRPASAQEALRTLRELA
ncbi:MAG: serine/threonine protein kinase, partial [Cyanobacteria bacterium]|nr:serine/threonine protein kinase [Cyanobacteriota bacterium]MDW8201445.1 serine/threonine-protein kinase [Cyanobacteriota bacterium SKYGB_h_bin112]